MQTVADDSTVSGANGGGAVTRENTAVEMCGDDLAFRCPRCGADTVAPFYAPCSACIGRLRAEALPPAAAAEVPAEAAPVTVSGVTTSRRYWRHKARPVAFVDGTAGRDAEGRAVTAAAGNGARFLASVAAYRMVYVCGAGAAERVRAMFTTAPAGWLRAATYEHDRHPSVTFTRAADGASVKLAPVDGWAGEAATPAAAADAWRWVAAHVADVFGGQLLATPSTTGRDLMARAFPADVELPTLSDDLCELVRSTSTQHRMELTAPAGLEVAGMVEIDMRLAFAAVVRELPAGRPEWITGEPATYDAHRHGRYLCRWTVPGSWSAVGVLPQLTGDGWRWDGTPGARGAGWVDGAELRQARQYGWNVHVERSLLWPVKAACDPLRIWQQRLVAMYADAEAARGLSAEAAGVARRMVRAIIIHGIGALRGKGDTITRTCAAGDAAGLVPAGVTAWLAPGDDEVVMWTERAEPSWPEWRRPEWTAAVWARTRCRLLDGPGARLGGGKGPRTGALNLPAGVGLVGFRGDAIYLTDNPGWHDDGAVGRYRVKAEHGAFTMPATLTELDAVRRGATRPAGVESIRAAKAALRKAAGS